MLKEMLESSTARRPGAGDLARRRGADRAPRRHADRTRRCGPATRCMIEPRSAYAYERIPKSEVEELVLEEVPDVDYADIGGLQPQIEQIRDAVELPFLHADLFREHQLRPPKGILLYGPPGCGKTLIAKAVANSLAKKIAERQRRGEAHQLLPQHQGPGAAQQVRRRDRAAHPADLPAGPGEGRRGHAGHRVLRRDGLGLPHPRLGCLLRRGEHHRPAAAQRDRRRGGAGERHRHRRLQPRGHDRPGDPAPRPARREDQDRAAGRRGGQGHLHQVHPRRPAAAPGRPGRARRRRRRPPSRR